MKVRTILQQKGHEVATVAPDASVPANIVQRLPATTGSGPSWCRPTAFTWTASSRREGACAGLAGRGRRSPGSAGVEPHEARCHDLRPDDEIRDLMAEMTHQRSRYIVSNQDHRLVGIVSIGDVVKSQLEDREQGSASCVT